MEPLYQETLVQIRNAIGDSCVYLVVDETTDCLNRNICNVLVGAISDEECKSPFLIHSAVLESTNHSTVGKTVNDALMILWPSQIHYDRLLLMLSDAATYMKKMGSALSVFYPKMIHLTCLAHALHRVAETIRNKFVDVNNLIANVKAIFVKAPARRQLFASATSLPLPPKVCITRWGTWLDAACYYADNFEVINNFVQQMEDESKAVRECKVCLAIPTLRSDLVFIKAHFGIISHSITKLEEQGMPLNDSMAIVFEVQQRLEQGGVPTLFALDKLNNCLKKNPGWSAICEINQCLMGVHASVPSFLSVANIAMMKNCPITSVDVERSFSEYKAFMRSNRSRLINIEQHIVVYYNTKRF